jgi:hypothetical protein
VSGSGDSPQKPYYLNPIACRHREESRRMILRAAELVGSGNVAILGGGACEEIPLVELLERFDSVALNDTDDAAIDKSVALLPEDPSLRGKLNVCVADLTGVTQSALQLIDEALRGAATPAGAAGAMAAALDRVKADRFPIAGRFDLIVCSCVLSQLHFALTHQAAARFGSRFPGQDDVLRESDAWKASLERTARGIEDRFIENLATLVAAGGLVYLSESAQVCFLRLAPDGRWQTQGTYRMLRTKELADYVRERFEIVGRNRWEWVVNAPQTTGDTGRLFDVQALVLKRKAEK